MGFPFLDILGIFEFLGDLNFVIKIFVLLTITSWVMNHLGKGPVSWILIAAVAYFVLFDAWTLFGPIYVLYMLLMFGISGIIIDFFFISAGGPPPPPEEGMESPVSSGIDIQRRMQEQAAHSHAARMMRR